MRSENAVSDQHWVDLRNDLLRNALYPNPVERGLAALREGLGAASQDPFGSRVRRTGSVPFNEGEKRQILEEYMRQAYREL